MGLRSKAGGLEVGREREHVAQVLGGGNDVDSLVVGNRREVVVDQVLAGSAHRLAIGLEGVSECGRLVRLDPIDDGRLVRAWIDLTSRGQASRPFLAQTIPPKLQDRVGVESVECPQGDHRIMPFAPDRPLLSAGRERALQPGAVQLDSDLGRLARPLQAALVRGALDARPGANELVEEGRHPCS